MVLRDRKKIPLRMKSNTVPPNKIIPGPGIGWETWPIGAKFIPENTSGVRVAIEEIIVRGSKKTL